MRGLLVTTLLLLAACTASDATQSASEPGPGDGGGPEADAAKLDAGTCVSILAPASPDRAKAVPAGNTKVQPGDPQRDIGYPRLHPSAASQFCPPVPMPGNVNTAGAEDSPFFDPTNGHFYFFFTPDMSLAAGQQVGDGYTGIWETWREGADWRTPTKLWLFEQASIEGCGYAHGDDLWTCAIATGTTEILWYHASRAGDGWTCAQQDSLLNRGELGIGELHMSLDGATVYYHSDAELPGRMGKRDLYRIERKGGDWGNPENLAVLNSAADEGYPALSPDETELWFTGDSRVDENHDGSPDYFLALFRSVKGQDASWQAPQEVVSSFAGEPTLDLDGNVYFIHHFTDGTKLFEADIYVLRRVPGGADAQQYCAGM